MRIRTLLQREPFPIIFEITLAGYLTRTTGREYYVHWRSGAPGSASDTRMIGQQWYCNDLLNMLFVDGTYEGSLEPIRREYMYSIARWRRPIQAFYVKLATSPVFARYFAHGSVLISPPIKDAAGILIVGGNHKIRILDRSRGLAHAICKEGFPREFMRREIVGRRLARSAGVPVPALIHVDPEFRNYTEEYVIGVPVNRLGDKTRAAKIVLMATGYMSLLTAHTLAECVRETYISKCVADVEALIPLVEHLPNLSVKRLKHGLEVLIQGLSIPGLFPEGVQLAYTHGDFHPANILHEGGRIWIIDWEYSDRRQAAYDPLVFRLCSRFPRGLSSRIRKYIDIEKGSSPDIMHGWPGVGWDDPGYRRATLSLFLLEEYILYLRENANPLFQRAGQTLIDWLEELPSCLMAIR